MPTLYEQNLEHFEKQRKLSKHKAFKLSRPKIEDPDIPNRGLNQRSDVFKQELGIDL